MASDPEYEKEQKLSQEKWLQSNLIIMRNIAQKILIKLNAIAVCRKSEINENVKRKA